MQMNRQMDRHWRYTIIPRNYSVRGIKHCEHVQLEHHGYKFSLKLNLCFVIISVSFEVVLRNSTYAHKQTTINTHALGHM